jgi:uncharacterized membrane protein YphA (DoxX/SURF4 family)
MMAGIFIYGGWDALRDPEAKAKVADDVAPMIAEALRLPVSDTVTLVRINGGVQVVAGTMLALGKARRLSALTLAASLIPTTYAGHRFWEEVDEERRAHQRIQFLKNAAMLGGLMLAAGDTGGRPSVPWQAKRAARHAVEAAAAAGVATGDSAKHALEATLEAQQAVARELSRRARKGTPKATVKARQAELAQLSDQARKLAQAVKESDLPKRTVEAAQKAAQKAAKKAKKVEFSRRAVKAARKGAQKAARQAEKADVAKRARKATRAAQQAVDAAANNIQKAHLPSHVGAGAAAAASRLQHANQEAFDWAREIAGDGGFERLRDTAASAAHHVAERAKDTLPLAS